MAPFMVEVMGDLPFYVPLPDKVMLRPSVIGAEPFSIEFEKFFPKRHPEEGQGANVDDRRGTFVRSRARVLFPLDVPPEDHVRAEYEEKAKSITNRAIESIRYVAFDHTIRRVEAFDRATFRVWQLHGDASPEPFGEWAQGETFGPFGLNPIGHLSNSALQALWFVFNGLTPTNPAWHLVLDAKYNNATGDISRAILDLGTALEINIPRLIDHYSSFNSDLMQMDLEGTGIFSLYHEVLMKATGHSLHESPEMYVALEYIRGVRNSITHEWKPVFRITPQMESASKYIDIHRDKDGHQVETKEEVEELIDDATSIITQTIHLFQSAYET